MEVVIPLVFILANHQADLRRRREHRRKKRKPRTFLTRVTLHSFTEQEACHIFRLTPTAIMELFSQISHKLNPHTKRSCAVPGLTKLLAVLHYMATGSFQYCGCAKFGISQPSFSRFFRQVIDAIVSLAPKYIKFPRSRAEQQRNKHLFYLKAGMPNVIALVDCTHICIIPPSDDEHTYRNRKNYHSLNVQMACGPNLDIVDVVAKYPGCSHDAFIMSNSRLGMKFRNGHFGDSVMLGDNGYRNLTWLLTPFLHPSSLSEQRYNKAHRKTRSEIERMFGILKSRFRSLDFTGGSILYKPELVGKLVVACCVVHNIANAHNVPVVLSEDLREHIHSQGQNLGDSSRAGLVRRQEVCRQYFS